MTVLSFSPLGNVSSTAETEPANVAWRLCPDVSRHTLCFSSDTLLGKLSAVMCVKICLVAGGNGAELRCNAYNLGKLCTSFSLHSRGV